jgi:hypothetical protein
MDSQRGYGAMRWSSQDRSPAMGGSQGSQVMELTPPVGVPVIADPQARPARPLEEQCIDGSGRLWISARDGVRVRVCLRVVRGQRLDPAQDLLLASHRRLPPRATSRTRIRISADEVGFAAWAS